MTNETPAELMDRGQRVADALAPIIGSPLTVTECRAWASITFAGWRVTMAAEHDVTVPSDFDPPDPDGMLFVDVAAIGPCWIEAIMIAQSEESPS